MFRFRLLTSGVNQGQLASPDKVLSAVCMKRTDQAERLHSPGRRILKRLVRRANRLESGDQRNSRATFIVDRAATNGRSGRRATLDFRTGALAALLSQLLCALDYPCENLPGSLLRSPVLQHLRMTHWNLRLTYGGISLQFDPIFRLWLSVVQFRPWRAFP